MMIAGRINMPARACLPEGHGASVTRDDFLFGFATARDCHCGRSTSTQEPPATTLRAVHSHAPRLPLQTCTLHQHHAIITRTTCTPPSHCFECIHHSRAYLPLTGVSHLTTPRLHLRLP
ncbi:hypothetical protein BDU57DRAFT_340303 [Ampelomyces quisqualis]|uniref:Uncharacterized protein n=1 Tax=Ampelomyces quisqualis TaxID=50730 RepID=A0A6A5QFU2_AMPQU|nr:hypothetical protein BDU57DRAFT_340303 [Ampelomyces quisqualis]